VRTKAPDIVTVQGWIDYHLGHPSNKVLDLGLKASILRADATDMTPGGRGVTDFYEKTVPGPQYGPLALPLAGAFAGGLWHYSKVLRNGFPDYAARQAAGRVFPAGKIFSALRGEGTSLLSSEGLGKIWNKLGTPGKGAAIGLALMLPFLPGMLGSRKTGGELRDIYSGEEPVPVRSGRWWEVGSTPVEGTRIKAWRPHWSVLHKARAEDISLYGSEAEKWKHNQGFPSCLTQKPSRTRATAAASLHPALSLPGPRIAAFPGPPAAALSPYSPHVASSESRLRFL